MAPSYDIQLPDEAAQGAPGIQASFSRVNVILGANGTGKSKLLVRLKGEAAAQFGGARPILFVEGGRVVQVPTDLGLNRGNFNEFQVISQAETNHRNQKQGKLADRTAHLLILLQQKGEHLKTVHSDAVAKWQEAGSVGSAPTREEPPVEKLFRVFHDVFPEITIGFQLDTKTLVCRKRGNRYEPQHLSDGERQVLALLADCVLLGDGNSLVVVDEPELNLHAHLASRLWDTVEASLPEAVFVYATHSLSFAMRGNVEAVFVLGGQERGLTHIANLGDADVEDLRPFLGSIPAILAAPAALVVEGDETSVDALFYEWLLARPDLVVVSVGNSYNVSRAAARNGVWEALAPTVVLAGVVDRDFKSDEACARLSTAEFLTVLDLHECESYLCHPELISTLAEKIGLVDPIPTKEEIEAEILDHLKSARVSIAARRTFARAELRLGVSLPKRALAGIGSLSDLESQLLEAAEVERKKADSTLSESAIKTGLSDEQARVEAAIAAGDVQAALTLLPGKQLLGMLLSRTGARSPSDLMRAAAHHLTPDQFPHIAALRSRLSTALVRHAAANDQSPG